MRAILEEQVKIRAVRGQIGQPEDGGEDLLHFADMRADAYGGPGFGFYVSRGGQMVSMGVCFQREHDVRPLGLGKGQ